MRVFLTRKSDDRSWRGRGASGSADAATRGSDGASDRRSSMERLGRDLLGRGQRSADADHFAVLSYVVRRIAYPTLPWLEVLKFPEVIVGGQLIAYVLVFCLMYALVAGVHRQHFLSAVRWNWPNGCALVLLGGWRSPSACRWWRSCCRFRKICRWINFSERRARRGCCDLRRDAGAPDRRIVFSRLLYPVLARRLEWSAGIFLTAVGFASIHGSQLTNAWGPVLIIFTVGLVLTWCAPVTKSVGASMLLHMGYNGTIAIAMYVGTDGFDHLRGWPMRSICAIGTLAIKQSALLEMVLMAKC